ncbi:MAG: CDGSH iron-sulfur domain-containing protein [Nitrososphaeraceae archaeon]
MLAENKRNNDYGGGILMEKADVDRQGQTKEKPKISPLTNGPYYLLNDMEPKVVENLQNLRGEPLSTVRGVALCRCGASNNKPFCDGTHGTIGFSSENKNAAVDNNDGEHIIKDKRKNYVGKEITIHDNRRICSHASECVNNLSSVFKLDSRPWINPDSARTQEIIDTIRKCPSGALSYTINGIEYRNPNEREPMVTVSKNGPYLITGGIDLIGDNIKWAEGASKEHYTLCRCGASNYKPFCDGMHRTVNFRDDKN